MAEVDGQTCEWCLDPAVQAVEMKRKMSSGAVPIGKYIYVCARHVETANRQVAAMVDNKSHKAVEK